MTLLDGKKVADDIKSELRSSVEAYLQKGARHPHLAAVLVGDNPASEAYVANKIRYCEEVGYTSTLVKVDSNISQNELLQVINKLNADAEVDGYIVQLPLPKHIDETEINLAIEPRKDVDGFHPTNFGKMALGLDTYLPATPYGIMELLRRYHIDTAGKHCVVLGRSNIVGNPISIMMAKKGDFANCTVTLTHSRTVDIKEQLQRADIIIAAIGIPLFVKADMVKQGAIVIDVGINRIEDASKKSGYALVGDVDFQQVADKCSYISPVPGGVGPMTVTALMLNTFKAYELNLLTDA